MNGRDKKSGQLLICVVLPMTLIFAGLHFVPLRGRLPTKTNLEVST